MADVDLDKIVEELDPEKISEKVGKPHEKARVGYKLEKIDVEDWEDFRKAIINYVKHHHKEVHGTELSDHRAYALAHSILSRRREEGGGGGIEEAYKTARGGKLRNIIDTLSINLQTEEEGAYRRHVLDKIDPLDFDANVELMKKYIAKYQSILPKGVKTKKPEELARDTQALITAHATDVYQATGLLKAYEPKKKK